MRVTPVIERQRARRVEICGPLGSGKSTLARILALRLDWLLASEEPSSVPYWREFSKRPDRFCCEKDVNFVFHYTDLVQRGADGPSLTPLVCDFSLVQCLAYADLFDDGHSDAIISPLYRRALSLVGDPLCVIVLFRPDYSCLKNVRQRGRAEEMNVELGYIRRVRQSIALRLGDLPNSCTIIHADLSQTDLFDADSLVLHEIVDRVVAVAGRGD